MKKIILPIIATAIIPLCSCASIVTGTSQSIAVDSNPVGAECDLSNDQGRWYLKETPGNITVHRSYSALTVSCKKDDLSGISTVESSTKTAAFGNIIFGGVVGAAVDMGSGAAYDYPPSITVKLSE